MQRREFQKCPSARVPFKNIRLKMISRPKADRRQAQSAAVLRAGLLDNVHLRTMLVPNFYESFH